MSDPMKDVAIHRDKKRRESVREDYTPVVLWVKPGEYLGEAKGRVDTEEIIRREIRDAAMDIPFFHVKENNEPRIEEIVTEFDKEEEQ